MVVILVSSQPPQSMLGNKMALPEYVQTTEWKVKFSRDARDKEYPFSDTGDSNSLGCVTSELNCLVPSCMHL